MVRIEGGRHPVIDLLLGEGEQYVPNNTEMSVSYQWGRGQLRQRNTTVTASLRSDLRSAYHGHYWTEHGREEFLYQTGKQLQWSVS